MSMTTEIRSKEQSHAEAQAKRCGYACGGAVDERQDKATSAKAVHKHESHMHKGEPQTALKSGGAVPGRALGGRLDQRARGGRTKGPSRINIVISTGGGEPERQMAMRQGMQLGAAAARPPVPPPGVPPQGAMPPRPPVPPPAMGAPAVPPGGGTLPPRPPMARGGRAAAYPLTVGSGGAKGRLEKHEAYEVAVRAHTRRKAGGRV